MVKPLRVLVVEDSEDDALLLVRELRRGGYDETYKRVDTPEALEAALDESEWDIVISDFAMPHFNGLDALKLVREKAADVPFILVSGTVGEDIAVEAMKAGANDYLMKDKLARLVVAVKRELREVQVRRERERAEEAQQASEHRFRELTDSIADVFFAMDKDFRYTYWNKASEQLTGIAAKDALGKSLYELFPDIRGTKAEQLYLAVLGTRQAKTTMNEYELGGKKYVFELSAYPSADGIAVLAKDITERRRAEEALREGEERYRDLTENMNDLVQSVAPDGSFVYVNRAWRDALGYSEEEVRSLSLWDIVHADSQAHCKEVFRRVLAGENVERIDAKFVTKDGRMVEVEGSANCRFVDDKPIATRGIFRDVTERGRAEEARRESEERYRDLVETTGDLVQSVAPDGSILFVNRAWREALGYGEDETPGLSLLDIIHPDSREHCMEVFKRVLGGENAANIEAAFVTKDGRTITVEGSASCSLVGGKPVATYGIFHDVTERRRAEEALRASEQKYRALVENTKDVAYSIDAEGRLTFLGPQAARYGVDPEEAVSRDLLEFIAPEDRERIAGEFRRTMTTGEEFPTEFRIVGADGGEHWFEDQGRVLRNASGEAVGVSGALRDVTERKQAEKVLRETEEQLLQSQKLEAVGRLAGGIAHDFNNMLGAIIGYSDVILGTTEKEDPLYRDIRHIKGAGDRAAALTRQLLAFSRKQTLEPKVMDLNAAIKGLEKMLRRLIGEDVELATVLADDLGRVRADPGQMDQVIMNLAVNSRDAMPEGGKLTIETASVDLDETYANNHVSVNPGPYVMLAITDTGCGMDEETRSHIFEPFFTTKEIGKGTGLGLSTVYGIVKQSGGNIWVYSEPGKGTTFKIYLPRVEEAVQALERRKPEEARARGSETILVVEDEEVLRRLVSRILGLAGYKVLEARVGGEALTHCEQHDGPIHLMLTDVVMPQMGGRQLAERVASLRPETKVLYMSGYTDDAIVRHGELRPGTPFIQKPFTASALATKVREVLDFAVGGDRREGGPK